MQIVDTNGNVVNNCSYDKCGNILSQKEGIENSFKYCVEIYDKETGLYYLRARYYDPSVGRFINEDTNEGDIKNPLSLNIYGYCHNNPVNYFDPSGNKEIITNYTYTYTHEVMVDDSGIFCTQKESVSLVQHTYTNLGLTVYEDPNHPDYFNNYPSELNKGNYQWVCDFSNPLFDEPVWTTNINALSAMDERAGHEITRQWAGVVLSGASDVVSVGKLAKGLKEGKSLLEAGKAFWPFSIPKDASDIPGTANTINTVYNNSKSDGSFLSKILNFVPVISTGLSAHDAVMYEYKYILEHNSIDNFNSGI